MKIVIVGNGMVGYKFCEKLRKKASADQVEIVVYGDEILPAYDRVHLSEYFENQESDKLLMADASWYTNNDIVLKTGELVTIIDTAEKSVITHKGNTEPYDYLVLATGSSAMVPPIKGVEKKGVFVYRKIEDLDQIIEFGKGIKRAAVLGGGLLGLEAAKAVMDMELLPHVIELAPRLMPRQLDTTGAGLLKDTIQELGIQVHLGKMSTEILGEEHISGLSFKDGTSLPLDMLVISAGIRPRDELAKKAELAVGPRGGIEVNEFMQTSDPDINAIGEAALYQQKIYGLVAPGYEMAQVALNHILGDPTPMAAEVDMSAKLKLIGVDVASFGDALTEDEGVKQITFEDKLAGVYKRVNVSYDKQTSKQELNRRSKRHSACKLHQCANENKKKKQLNN